MKLVWTNILSLIYAGLSALYLILNGNILRLQEWFPTASLTAISIAAVAVLTILWYPLVRLTGKYVDSNARYLSTVLWLPYALLFVWISAAAFPITQAQYMPGPGLVFFLLPRLVLIPLYILSVNFFSSLRAQ